MVKLGRMVTCDRCGKTLFQESSKEEENDLLDISDDWMNWAQVKGIGDLCPDCYEQYQETIEDFMERGRRDV